LERRHKSDPEKLALAARRRRQTTLTIKAIAARLHLGAWQNATTPLHARKRREDNVEQVQMS
jgi:hypothetical protein